MYSSSVSFSIYEKASIACCCGGFEKLKQEITPPTLGILANRIACLRKVIWFEGCLLAGTAVAWGATGEFLLSIPLVVSLVALLLHGTEQRAHVRLLTTEIEETRRRSAYLPQSSSSETLSFTV